jgi:apolipoprotein N-acyltransferase
LIRAPAIQPLLALATGAILTLAFAPFGWWPLAVLCPAAMLLLWRKRSPGRAAWLGLCFGVGYFGAGTWWLYISIHDMADAPAWLALLLVTLVVALMAWYYALLGWLVARILPHDGAWRYLAGAPALWLLLEWLRSWLFTGFPWLSLGYAFTDTWLAGWATVLGVYGLSALALGAAGVLAALLDGTRRAAWIGAGSLALLAAAALWLRAQDWTAPTGALVSVAVVQGATPQNIKWQVGNRLSIRGSYERLNAQALGARLVVWPEAAVPELADLMPQFLARIFREANVRGSDVVMGVLRLGGGDDRVYNSVLALSTPVAFYDKRHLVPYSEYFPVPDWVRGVLRRMNLPYSDISKGSEQQPPLRAGGLELAPTVCYEDAFGNAQRRLSASSDVLLNVTNDAWFGHSPARYQHFQMGRLRAIEAQRYLVRAANDGVSAVVGPRGEVLASAPEYEEAVMRGTVQARRGLTPYLRLGDWPLLAFAGLVAVLAVLKSRRRLIYKMP